MQNLLVTLPILYCCGPLPQYIYNGMFIVFGLSILIGLVIYLLPNIPVSFLDVIGIILAIPLFIFLLWFVSSLVIGLLLGNVG